MIFRKIVLCGALATSVVVAAPAAFAAKAIIVDVAPPALRVETVPPPRHGYYWAPGYWGWSHNKHAWYGGHWIRERPGYRWEAPRWEERNGRWHYHDGRWEH